MAEDDKKADEEKDAATTENDASDSDDADESAESADGGESADGDDSDKGDEDKGDEDEAAASEDDAADAPPVVEPPRKRRTRNVQEVGAPPPPAGIGKSVFVFIGIFAVLAGGFFVLGNSEPFGGAGNKPKWAVGQKVAIDLTLDPRDDVKLGCASNIEIKGRRCEFEDKNKKFAGKLEDATQLRPYTTTDGTQLLAAGLWSQPELAPAKRPTDRFTVRCQYTVEGMVKNPAIQWDRGPNWIDQQRDWHAGTVSDCKLQK